MTYQEALDFIHSMHRLGKKAGLSKITQLMEYLGNPQKQLKFVHVAGTNGKGSTTTMTAHALTQAGYKTGLFISPYILNFRERMQIDGQLIPEEELVACVQQVKPFVEQMAAQGNCPAEFEVDTALALCWFAQQHCDIVVLEVGLGGRFDATNIIQPPLVAAITSIGLDHTEILGDTIAKIAFEKCGIIKTGSTVVCYPDQHPEALPVIMEQCALRQVPMVMGNKNAAEVKSMGLDGTNMTYGGISLHIPLVGPHQVYNTITALEILFVLRQKGFDIPDDAIAKGIDGVRFPARFEIISQSPLVVVDGAHNVSGAQALRDTLDLFPHWKVVAIAGMLGDKDVDGVLSLLGPRCRRMITVTPDSTRALSQSGLAQRAAKYCADVTPCSNLEEAFAMGYNALEDGELLLSFGSLYLASDMRVIARDFLDNKKREK